MTVIPKPIFIYKLRIFNIGEALPFDTIYCLPDNLHHWVGADYAEDGHKLVIDKIWISPARYKQLFPLMVYEASVAAAAAEEW